MAVVRSTRSPPARPPKKSKPGDTNVSVGNYAGVLQALGLLDGLSQIADIGNDPVGQALATAELPKHVHLKRPAHAALCSTVIRYRTKGALRDVGKPVTQWLARPGCCITLHFIPTYCPHLNPIERLWGLMHKHVTHIRCHPRFFDLANAVLKFLRHVATKEWHTLCDQVSENLRVIDPKDFRVLK
jgi:transposase